MVTNPPSKSGKSCWVPFQETFYNRKLRRIRQGSTVCAEDEFEVPPSTYFIKDSEVALYEYDGSVHHVQGETELVLKGHPMPSKQDPEWNEEASLNNLGVKENSCNITAFGMPHSSIESSCMRKDFWMNELAATGGTLTCLDHLSLQGKIKDEKDGETNGSSSYFYYKEDIEIQIPGDFIVAPPNLDFESSISHRDSSILADPDRTWQSQRPDHILEQRSRSPINQLAETLENKKLFQSVGIPPKDGVLSEGSSFDQTAATTDRIVGIRCSEKARDSDLPHLPSKFYQKDNIKAKRYLPPGSSEVNSPEKPFPGRFDQAGGRLSSQIRRKELHVSGCEKETAETPSRLLLGAIIQEDANSFNRHFDDEVMNDGFPEMHSSSSHSPRAVIPKSSRHGVMTSDLKNKARSSRKPIRSQSPDMVRAFQKNSLDSGSSSDFSSVDEDYQYTMNVVQTPNPFLQDTPSIQRAPSSFSRRKYSRNSSESKGGDLVYDLHRQPSYFDFDSAESPFQSFPSSSGPIERRSKERTDTSVINSPKKSLEGPWSDDESELNTEAFRRFSEVDDEDSLFSDLLSVVE
jgi:hypothetical protein